MGRRRQIDIYRIDIPATPVCSLLHFTVNTNRSRDSPGWAHDASGVNCARAQHGGESCHHFEAMDCVSDELRNKLLADREFVLDAVSENVLVLELFSEEIHADREFVLAAVRHNGQALEYASEELQADREVVLAAVRQNGEALLWT